MENKEERKIKFNLVFTSSPDFSPVRLPGYCFLYRSEKIEKPATTSEIWKASKSFLKEIEEQYNSYQIPEYTKQKTPEYTTNQTPEYTTNQPPIYETIATTYRINTIEEGKQEKGNEYKHDKTGLYYSMYKIEGERKNKIEEKKRFRPTETIEANFYIYILATVYLFRERAYNPGENIEKEKENILKLSKCCICKKKPPNVLFYRCFHRVACSDCDESEKFRYCPVCRNNLNGTRKETYFKKNFYITSPTISPKPF